MSHALSSMKRDGPAVPFHLRKAAWLQRFDRINMDSAVAAKRALHLHVIALVALHGVRIGNRQNLLVLVGHQYGLGAALDALLGAGGMRRPRALGATV